MKHNWFTDKDGNPDDMAWDEGYHNGVMCRDCGKCVCVYCEPDYMEMDDCHGAPTPKNATNSDRIRACIRSMSDDELAEFLCGVYNEDENGSKFICGYIIPDYDEINIKEWLQRPAKEEIV